MFETPTTRAVKPPSKDTILQQADGLRDIARRCRKLAETIGNEADQRRLERYVEELGDSARRLEKAAIDAKTG